MLKGKMHFISWNLDICLDTLDFGIGEIFLRWVSQAYNRPLAAVKKQMVELPHDIVQHCGAALLLLYCYPLNVLNI